MLLVDDFPDVPMAVDPPAVRLPLLTLEEAQELLMLLAAVLDGDRVDEEFARYLLGNLAARVPSRD